ncbi:MAG: potassium channel protein [Planctomycetota bacterium]|nr:MAG: potassium channel protein [Planctomycetota bacterium]
MASQASTAGNGEQRRALRQLEDWLETPMFVLSLVWSGLLAYELIWGADDLVNRLTTAVWVVFLVEFALRMVIAPRKLVFLRKSWLTALALVLPALRVFRLTRVLRVLRAGRAVRGLTLARVFTAFNRGLRSLQRTMGRFGFGYVLALTVLVTVLGAAGMYYFERGASGSFALPAAEGVAGGRAPGVESSAGGLNSFGDALWFTGMLMTTSGSDYWPKTGEGRLLCFVLALYAFAIFGYVTATLATLLVGRQRDGQPTSELNEQMLDRLSAEIRLLRSELRSRARTPG